MPATKTYMKAWRKKHPHYHRDWMRQDRGCEADVIGRKPHRKVILGVTVSVDYFHSPVSKARATQEFLDLTAEMF